MGEIYVSPCNHLPLDEMLLVPLVFVDRSEKAGVEPRLLGEPPPDRPEKPEQGAYPVPSTHPYLS